MSDDPREAARELKKINICNDVWFDVFACVHYTFLGIKFALVSAHFDAIVDKQLRRRNWSLRDDLEVVSAVGKKGPKIYKSFWDKTKQKGARKELPFATFPTPSNVICFKELTICHVDQDVIKFIGHISPLFNDLTLTVFINHEQIYSWQIMKNILWPLIAKKISIFILGQNMLACLLKFISDNAICECTNLQYINSMQFRTMPLAGNRWEVPVRQALSKWIQTPLSDGRPKVLNMLMMCHIVKETVGQLKMAFTDASTPSKYIIGMRSESYDGEQFLLENEQTRERLTLRHRTQERIVLLTRGPIEWDEKHWTPWEYDSIHNGPSIVKSSLIIELNDLRSSCYLDIL